MFLPLVKASLRSCSFCSGQILYVTGTVGLFVLLIKLESTIAKQLCQEAVSFLGTDFGGDYNKLDHKERSFLPIAEITLVVTALPRHL